MLAHVADILAVLKQTSDEDEVVSPSHGEDNLISDVESDGVDDEDESAGEESVSCLIVGRVKKIYQRKEHGH